MINKKRLQRGRHRLANHGIELTPDQYETSFRSALQEIKEAMVAKGHIEFASMSDDRLSEEIRLVLGDDWD